MVTSRTGTAQWKRVSGQAIYRAKRGGLTNCPHCNVLLDYEQPRTKANSVWVDHVFPASKGGQDVIENTAIMCRTCNISKGNREAPKPIKPIVPLRTSRKW